MPQAGTKNGRTYASIPGILLTKVQVSYEFEELKSGQDSSRLLRLIREVMNVLEKYLQDMGALVIANKDLHTFYHQPEISNDKSLKLFNLRDTVLETLGGHLPIHPKLINKKLVGMSCSDLENPNPSMLGKATTEAAWKEYLSALFSAV